MRRDSWLTEEQAAQMRAQYASPAGWALAGEILARCIDRIVAANGGVIPSRERLAEMAQAERERQV